MLSNYDKALEYYNKVINDWPEYEGAGGVAGIIANVYEMMKEDGLISGDSADKLIVDAYQMILDRFPESPAVKAAKDKIYMHNMEAERAKQVEQNRNSSTPFFLRAMRGGAQ